MYLTSSTGKDQQRFRVIEEILKNLTNKKKPGWRGALEEKPPNLLNFHELS
tara:strand:+ start:343 stop:495 length:153 start_codon:yes stop_codon:yes gene_type:complete